MEEEIGEGRLERVREECGEGVGREAVRDAGHRMVEVIQEVSLTGHTIPPPRSSARLHPPPRPLFTI